MGSVCPLMERSTVFGCAKVLTVTTNIIWDMENILHHGDIPERSITTNICTTLMAIITISINTTEVKELTKSNENDANQMTKQKNEERTRRTKIRMTQTTQTMA